MSSDRLFQIEFFVQVAELGSLTKAAEKLEMSNAAASRTLLALEERLGARLVERTTRRLWLTEVGQIFSHALAGNKTVDEALAEAQAVSLQTMTEGGWQFWDWPQEAPGASPARQPRSAARSASIFACL